MSATNKPTRKQLGYLRHLAASRGQTFRYPQTKREASDEIARLKAGKPDSRLGRAIERAEGERHVRRDHLDATTFRRDEVEGYGSTARWAGTGEEH